MNSDDNKIAGTVGALIGAVLGIVIWCIIGLFGRIAWIGGFAICICSLGGYYLLGKDISKIGLGIVAVIVIISVYVATRMNWAIALHNEFSEFSLWWCYKNIIGLLELAGDKSAFYGDLAIGYVMTLLGGFSALRKFAV